MNEFKALGQETIKEYSWQEISHLKILTHFWFHFKKIPMKLMLNL